MVDQTFHATIAGSTLKTNLVSWWALQEASGNSRLDSVTASANDLIENGTVNQTTGHVQANAASFGGATYLKITDNGSLAFNGSFTVAGWINITTASGTQAIIAKGGEFRCMVLDNGGLYEWAIQSLAGGGELLFATTFGALSATTWYFVVATYNGSNQFQVSVNNSAFDQIAVGTPIAHGGAELQLGAASGSLFFTGAEEQWGFWTRVLSSSEVGQLWNGGAGKTYSSL